MSPPNEIKVYPLTGSDSQQILDHAKAVLKQHLPVSIPIYRRLQFGRFFEATSLLTNVHPDQSPLADSPWLFAFVDRSCRPETEVWMFGSWEDAKGDLSPEEQEAIDDLVRNLVSKMKDLKVPTSIHQDLLDAKAEELELVKDKGGFSRDEYGGHMVDPNIMLCGAIHERTVSVFKRLGCIDTVFKAGQVPNYTFIWDVDPMQRARDLPQGLKWGHLKQENFALVRSRTQIPRQDRTLAVLPNLGIFTDDEHETPVSWAFIGLDASLSTLHVETAWRGRGLAKALTTKLFKEKMEMFWEPGEKRLAHGYVIAGNAESEGMCRSLGGKSGWNVYWIRLALDAPVVRPDREIDETGPEKGLESATRRRSSSGAILHGT